jgi:alkane 1-monooxygenase
MVRSFHPKLTRLTKNPAIRALEKRQFPSPLRVSCRRMRHDVFFAARCFADKKHLNKEHPEQMLWYAIASLTPAVLLALAMVLGGPFPALALVSITAVVFLLDRVPLKTPQPRGTGRALSLTLALVHFPLLGLGIWAIGAGTHLGTADGVLIFIALGMWAGQVSNSNAHELIHAGARLPARIGAAVYVSLLHGHHVSAHLKVHHVYAATDADPNSAPLGLGFWRYAARACTGEFLAGLRAENTYRARRNGKQPLHPYVFYLGGAAALLTLSCLIAGPFGVILHLGIAFYAQLQLLLSDYVQHYGLRRTIRDGKPEPIGPHHSWNAPQWYSNAMMLNAPKHSDHHLRPARAFPALELTPATMPVLPRSLPVMAALALVPPLWHRVMDHRAVRWQNAAGGC